MNKTIIWMLGIVMVLATLQGAMADDFGTARFVSYYKYDDNTATDEVLYSDGTLNGTTNVSGYIGSAQYFDGSSYIEHLGVPTNYTRDKNFTINAWANVTSLGGGGDYYKLFGRASGSTTNGVWLMVYSNGQYAFNVGDGGTSCNTNGGNISVAVNTYNMITATYDGSNIKTYINGQPDDMLPCTVTSGQTDKAYWGARNDLSEVWVGEIDEPSISLWMTDQEVLDLYNNMSAGNQYPFESQAAVPAGFVAPTPANDSHNSTQVTLNVSCDSGNHYLWFDGNSTPLTLVLDNTTSGEYTTTETVDGQYYYHASCDADLTQNTSVYTWFYDTTSPSLNLNPNNAFRETNTSTTNQYNNSVFLNMTFTDNIDLYAYGVNITSSNGTNMWGVVNTSISGLTYLYEEAIDIGDLPPDLYAFTVQVADSHTDHEIPEYEVEEGLNYITFNTPDGNSITIESETDMDSSFQKLDDRYTFSFDFLDASPQTRNFIVKSENDNSLDYIEHSDYAAHIVAWSGFGGNWIDFEGTDQTPEVTVLNDKTIRVKFENLGGNVEFQSIGGLNVNTFNYTWYRGNYTNSNPFGLINENTTLGLNVDFGGTIEDMNAILYYNDTNQGTYQKSNNNTQYFFNNTFTNVDAPNNITYYWEVTVNQTDGNFTYFNTTTYTHNVYDFGILECSGAANTTTVTFQYNDENHPEISLNASIEVEFESWVSDPDNSVTFTSNLTQNKTHTYCLIPAGGTIYSNVYAKYTTSGGFTHRYILRNHTFTNTTQTLTLYNTNETTGFSDLKLTTRYQSSYEYYKDVIVKLQRRYVGEGIYRTVQMDRSGDFGLSFFNIKEESVDYRLIFTDLNDTSIKTSTTLKFVCDSGVCNVVELLTPPSTTTAVETLTYIEAFSNVSRNLTANWTDPEGDTRTINALVIQYLPNGTNYVCNITQSASAGTFTCELSGVNGTVHYIIKADGSSVYSRYFDVKGLELGDLIGQKEGAFWSFIIVASIALLSLASPIIAVIAAILGLIIISILGIFSPVTLTFIIIAGIMGSLIGFKIRR